VVDLDLRWWSAFIMILIIHLRLSANDDGGSDGGNLLLVVE